MIKLLDFDVAQPGVVTIYADTKEEVPETDEALKAALEGDLTNRWDSDIAAGSLIITSTFDVAFVRSDGLIQWKGDEPVEPEDSEIEE